MITTSSVVARRGIQVASPVAVVVAVYLLFAGHNRPGGGFAAGLVLGAVVVLRRVAGLQRNARPVMLLAGGALLAGAVALAPLLVGDALLDQVVVEATLPLVGKAKSGSALLFDIGVMSIVVGMVVAVLDGLGMGALAEDHHPAPGEVPSP